MMMEIVKKTATMKTTTMTMMEILKVMARVDHFVGSLCKEMIIWLLQMHHFLLQIQNNVQRPMLSLGGLATMIKMAKGPGKNVRLLHVEERR